jgi:hypothetical protein
MQIDTQATDAAKTDAAEPATFTKRIGSTTYTVAVHFSKTSKETMGDKILRMIKNDVVSK